jgi:hypothetical protein
LISRHRSSLASIDQASINIALTSTLHQHSIVTVLLHDQCLKNATPLNLGQFFQCPSSASPKSGLPNSLEEDDDASAPWEDPQTIRIKRGTHCVVVLFNFGYLEGGSQIVVSVIPTAP